MLSLISMLHSFINFPVMRFLTELRPKILYGSWFKTMWIGWFEKTYPNHKQAFIILFLWKINQFCVWQFVSNIVFKFRLNISSGHYLAYHAYGSIYGRRMEYWQLWNHLAQYFIILTECIEEENANCDFDPESKILAC